MPPEIFTYLKSRAHELANIVLLKSLKVSLTLPLQTFYKNLLQTPHQYHLSDIYKTRSYFPID